MTERLHFHFSLSCIGEGNGNPLQYCCLENPGKGKSMGCHLWGCTELDTTEETAAAAAAEGTNGRITEAEERISEVEDRMVEINEVER